MSHKTKSKSERKSVGTQTQKNDAMLEIARLQEQVKLLKIENDHLRKYTIEDPSAKRSLSPKVSPNTEEFSMLNETKQKNLTVPKSTQKKTARGCTCKGKCASKICGCVKKDSQCGEWCKCKADVCQNKESKDANQNKENLDQNESPQTNSKDQQLANKHLANVAASKGLFSPDVAVDQSPLNLQEFRSSSIYFGKPKQLKFLFDDEEEDEGDKNEKQQKAEKKEKPKKKSVEVASSENTRRLRSSKEGIDQNIMVTLRHRPKGSKKKVTQAAIISDSDSKEESSPVSGEAETKEPRNEVAGEIAKAPEKEIVDPDHDFDPMKPKHELPRTPVQASDETISRNVSNSSFSVLSASSNTTKEEEETEIPVELTQPEVDWEEYQAQLVACNKCKRRFHPLRIKKHQSCCKKV